MCVFLYIEYDDKHTGRKRNFAHVKGNWSTHIELLVTITEHIHHILTSIQQQLLQQYHIKCHLMNTYHISLSRTQPIRTSQIHPLRQALLCLSTHYNMIYRWTHYTVYMNDERTRSFISLTTGDGEVEDEKKEENKKEEKEEISRSKSTCTSSLTPISTSTSTSTSSSTTSSHSSTYTHIIDMINSVNTVFTQFGLQTYYEVR